MNALRRAHSNERRPNGSEDRDPLLIYIGLTRIHDGHLVGSTCDVIDIGHMRSHLHNMGRTRICGDDVRPTEFLHQIVRHRRTLPPSALRNIYQSSVLSRFNHDAWSRDLSVGIPAMHFTPSNDKELRSG